VPLRSCWEFQDYLFVPEIKDEGIWFRLISLKSLLSIRIHVICRKYITALPAVKSAEATEKHFPCPPKSGLNMICVNVSVFRSQTVRFQCSSAAVGNKKVDDAPQFMLN
jgi:hypothetical protein